MWTLRDGRWQDDSDLPDMVDHVITDAPFDAHTHANGRARAGLAARQGGEGDGSLSFDGVDPFDVGPALVARVRRWCVIKCSLEQLGLYQAAYPDAHVRSGLWVKTNAAPQFTGDRPAVGGEGVAILHGTEPKRWNGGGRHARWVGLNCAGSSSPYDADPQHETQMPLWLASAWVRDFTDEGEMVWDPFAGYATIGVACILLGRRYLGHERDPAMAAKARQRLEAAARGQTVEQLTGGQVPLFGGG